LLGACHGCGHACQTVRMVAERSLKEMVDERIRLIEV
jgi:Fe-S cluster biogenesis protein NfuA